MTKTAREIAKTLGFEPELTGGGCVALTRYWKSGSHVMLTDNGGLQMPESLNDWIVCVYPPEWDGEQIEWDKRSTDSDALPLEATLSAAIEHAYAVSIAAEFVERLKAQLSDADYQEMQRRNATPAYAGNICASHDFCDANMPMAEAFAAIMGRDFLPEEGEPSETDCALWGAAWTIAKAGALTATGES